MILDMFKLDGKVAIVTGANSGIGQGIATGLAEAGADIVGVGRSNMDETKNLIESLGRRFLPIKANLLTTEPVKRIIEEAIKEFSHIDILVNNAGIIKRSPAIDYPEEYWDDTLNTNLKTVFFLSQAVAKQYIKQGNGGKIINIVSLLAYEGGVFVPGYTASKSAVMGLTRALSNEWIKHDINVNGIAPGYIATKNTSPLREDEKRNKEILDRIPAGRWGSPDDIRGAAVFLASHAASYVSGYTVAVDGGWLAR